MPIVPAPELPINSTMHGDRAITRAVRLRRRLGGDGSLHEPFPRRPKEMKQKTWWRLLAKAIRDEQRWLIGAAASALSAKLGRRRPARDPDIQIQIKVELFCSDSMRATAQLCVDIGGRGGKS